MVNPAIGGRRDNRKLEGRADVVTFTSPPLSAPLEVLGNPVVEVVHETDNPYADLFVRLCEVGQDGRSINVSDGFRRLGPADANGTIMLRLDALAQNLKSWRLTPSGTEGYERAEVTVGGVDTRALSSATMECRQVPGLYFIGEGVDVTGWLGGYNFQWAWASGFAAGQAA